MICIEFIILTVAFLMSFYMNLIRNIHIYQLNHYKNKFQFTWIKNNISKELLRYIILISIGLSIVLIDKIGFVIAALLYLLLALIERPKEAKKPIIYTNRVIRLIITGYLFNFILAIISIAILNTSMAAVILMPIISLFTPLLLILYNAINKPINYFINKYYVDDAKKIIKNMPNLIVIGVTGSYGKTSVKNFLYKFLSAKYNVLVTPGNYNTELGVVKTIRSSLKATHEVFICEMGADEVGQIKKTCKVVNPKYGVITSLGPQHLETFGSMDNILKAKFELANSLPQDGVLFLNYDNEYLRNVKTDKQLVTYGTENSKLDCNAHDIKVSNKGLEFCIEDENGKKQIFTTELLGKHNVTNIAGAVAVAKKLGVPTKAIVQRVRQLESVEHRLQLIKNANGAIIDDAYNSNPMGAKSALDTLAAFDGIKILVTPGMIELGEKQYECNYTFGKQAAAVCDYIVLIGKKQTEPIYNGVLDSKFPKDKLFVADTLKQGLSIVNDIKSGGRQKIILLENDLPDNY